MNLSTAQRVTIWINRTLGTVAERAVRRVYRNSIGDWCAEVVVADQIRIGVFAYHPSAALLQLLRNGGTDIADYLITGGAEGINVRRRTGPADT